MAKIPAQKVGPLRPAFASLATKGCRGAEKNPLRVRETGPAIYFGSRHLTLELGHRFPYVTRCAVSILGAAV